MSGAGSSGGGRGGSAVPAALRTAIEGRLEDAESAASHRPGRRMPAGGEGSDGGAARTRGLARWLRTRGSVARAVPAAPPRLLAASLSLTSAMASHNAVLYSASAHASRQAIGEQSLPPPGQRDPSTATPSLPPPGAGRRIRGRPRPRGLGAISHYVSLGAIGRRPRRHHSCARDGSEIESGGECGGLVCSFHWTGDSNDSKRRRPDA